MRLHNPEFGRDAGQGQIFWLAPEDVTFAPSRHILFQLINDNQVHEYRVDLSASPTWPKDRDLVCFRLDPANGPCELEILSVGLIG
jgi:hypothetical protein